MREDGDDEHIWTVGENGQMCGAEVVWREKRRVRGGGESGRNGSVFGVEREIGGRRGL